MLITDKFIFVQVPRTSSSSMTEAIMEVHATATTDIHASFLEGFEVDTTGRDIYAFVRNPFEREFSQWKYHTSKEDDVLEPITFEEWVYWRYSGLTLPLSRFRSEWVHGYLRSFSTLPQLGWLLNKESELLVNNIGFFEDRAKYTELFCDQMGVPTTDFPHIEKSHGPIPTSDYQEHYTQHMREVIEKAYLPDLQAFGYGFGKDSNQEIDLSKVTDFSFLNGEGYYLHRLIK